jgi:protein-S-isoprenylcysteine O-methyltransferase Ste14
MSSRVTAWLLVIAQFALIAAVALAPGAHWEVTAVHLAVSAAAIGSALLIGVWAALWLGRGLTPLPLPNGQVDLVTGGPYRWIRHPMYSAVMLGMGGVAVASGSWWAVVAWLALTVLLNLKARWEERHLMAAFPGYTAYRRGTGYFLPRSDMSP